MILSTQIILRGLVRSANSSYLGMVQSRSIKYWPEPRSTANIFMPRRIEDRSLPTLLQTPTNAPEGVTLPVKYGKDDIDMRGPERVHNQLIYRQYGIVALGGGALTGAHIEMIKAVVDRWLDTERFFAAWRIDPPWKAVSKKSMGKRLGGGKAKVHHYETPVRAGRIIIEIGGIGEFGEVQRILDAICKRLPIYAMPISQELMDNIKREKLQLDQQNYNPFDYRDLLRRNFSNASLKVNSKEILWGGTYY